MKSTAGKGSSLRDFKCSAAMGMCCFDPCHVCDTCPGLPLVSHLYPAAHHIGLHTKVVKAQKSKHSRGHMAPITCVYALPLVR